MKKRILLKDVAEAAGYGRSTVSMALRDHPKIPAKTRETIKQVAAKLGYEKDPMLSSLSAYRDGQRSQSSWQGSLAALVLDASWPWNAIPLWENVYQAMKHCSRNLGYELTEYCVDTPNLSLKEHQERLQAQGITGLILPPIESFPYAELDWDLFSVIGFGFDSNRNFDAVATDNARATLGCIDQCIHAGYRRIGMILPEGMFQPRHYREIGCFLFAREMQPDLELCFMNQDTNSASSRTRWIEEHRIEAVIGYSTGSDRDFEQMQLPFLSINVVEPDSPISGYYHSPEELGATLIHQLHALISRGSTGIPELQTSIIVAGTWNEGRTIRAKAPTA